MSIIIVGSALFISMRFIFRAPFSASGRHSLTGAVLLMGLLDIIDTPIVAHILAIRMLFILSLFVAGARLRHLLALRDDMRLASEPLMMNPACALPSLL